ncbi:Uncharacterised protein [Mycobacteroides abscessus subsp. abscessus]|nr:Uncharacterised protein [Mycobacteroides abscessus subsp. abscessus]
MGLSSRVQPGWRPDSSIRSSAAAALACAASLWASIRSCAVRVLSSRRLASSSAACSKSPRLVLSKSSSSPCSRVSRLSRRVRWCGMSLYAFSILCRSPRAFAAWVSPLMVGAVASTSASSMATVVQGTSRVRRSWLLRWLRLAVMLMPLIVAPRGRDSKLLAFFSLRKASRHAAANGSAASLRSAKVLPPTATWRGWSAVWVMVSMIWSRLASSLAVAAYSRSVSRRWRSRRTPASRCAFSRAVSRLTSSSSWTCLTYRGSPVAMALVSAAAPEMSPPPRSSISSMSTFSRLTCSMNLALASTFCHITVSNAPSVT